MEGERRVVAVKVTAEAHAVGGDTADGVDVRQVGFFLIVAELEVEGGARGLARALPSGIELRYLIIYAVSCRALDRAPRDLHAVGKRLITRDVRGVEDRGVGVGRADTVVVGSEVPRGVDTADGVAIGRADLDVGIEEARTARLAHPCPAVLAFIIYAVFLRAADLASVDFDARGGALKGSDLRGVQRIVGVFPSRGVEGACKGIARGVQTAHGVGVGRADADVFIDVARVRGLRHPRPAVSALVIHAVLCRAVDLAPCDVHTVAGAGELRDLRGIEVVGVRPSLLFVTADELTRRVDTAHGVGVGAAPLDFSVKEMLLVGLSHACPSVTPFVVDTVFPRAPDGLPVDIDTVGSADKGSDLRRVYDDCRACVAVGDVLLIGIADLIPVGEFVAVGVDAAHGVGIYAALFGGGIQIIVVGSVGDMRPFALILAVYGIVIRLPGLLPAQDHAGVEAPGVYDRGDVDIIAVILDLECYRLKAVAFSGFYAVMIQHLAVHGRDLEEIVFINHAPRSSDQVRDHAQGNFNGEKIGDDLAGGRFQSLSCPSAVDRLKKIFDGLSVFEVVLVGDDGAVDAVADVVQTSVVLTCQREHKTASLIAGMIGKNGALHLVIVEGALDVLRQSGQTA